jgi:hypothetical protein
VNKTTQKEYCVVFFTFKSFKRKVQKVIVIKIGRAQKIGRRRPNGMNLQYCRINKSGELMCSRRTYSFIISLYSAEEIEFKSFYSNRITKR